MKAFTRIVILWVSGLTWKTVDMLHTIDALRAEGVTVTALNPLPITGQQLQAWQMLNGQNPGDVGYFDTWTPRQYTAYPTTGPEISLLHEKIHMAGRTSISVDLALVEVPSYLKEAPISVDCLIIHATASIDAVTLDEAITAARAWAGTEGAFLLLSEQQEAVVKNYVNLNDGLCALGVLDVSEQHTICWGETLAYHVGHGQLWINLEGREPSGIVMPGEEYDQICQALIRSLPLKLLDPHTGEPMIERIYHRNEVYSGDYLFQAPDLVVVFQPGYAPSPRSVTLGLDGEVVRFAPPDTRATAGLHPATVAGLAIAVGTPFAAGQVIAQTSLINIASAILHAMHLPLPTSLDTEIITNLFTPEYLQLFPVQRVDEGSGLSPEEEGEIMARLKSLGYIS